jgi:hypothetical protein
MGEDHVARRPTGDPARLPLHPSQHRRDQVHHANLALAQPHRPVVDAPLRADLQPGRIRHAAALSVLTGSKSALAGEDRRRQKGRGVDARSADAPAPEPAERPVV